MRTKTNVKAGGFVNHNEKLNGSKTLTVKTGIKSGGFANHNEKLIG